MTRQAVTRFPFLSQEWRAAWNSAVAEQAPVDVPSDWDTALWLDGTFVGGPAGTARAILQLSRNGTILCRDDLPDGHSAVEFSVTYSDFVKLAGVRLSDAYGGYLLDVTHTITPATAPLLEAFIFKSFARFSQSDFAYPNWPAFTA